MDVDSLNSALLVRTDGELGLEQVASRYLADVRRMAEVIGVGLAASGETEDGKGVRLTLDEDPDLVVTWQPDVGWAHNGHSELSAVYRVSEEAGAAGMVPAPEIIAAWLLALADGDRSGHENPPEEWSPQDPALLELLATAGQGHE